jgi:hypothetical protein
MKSLRMKITKNRISPFLLIDKVLLDSPTMLGVVWKNEK